MVAELEKGRHGHSDQMEFNFRTRSNQKFIGMVVSDKKIALWKVMTNAETTEFLSGPE
jgi:hypothetical protein